MKDKVIVREETLVIPTYDLKDENRNPVFQSRYGVAHIYPYTLQDHIDFEVKDKQYRVIILENQFLKVTVIPDLGGRVYSVFDKISHREVFYKNQVVKFSPLAIRGAFFSGGVEFSFPVAHAPTTCDKVNWHMQEHDDGSASLSIGGIEHISRLKWMVTLTLYPDLCALSQDVYLKNPTNIPGRYHYWTNASLDADKNTEFIYPFHRSRSYEYAGTAAWPVARIDLIQEAPILPGMEGVPMWPANNLQMPINFRWQENMLAQVSIFGRDIEWEYFGAWQHSANHGYAHVADPNDVSGMKLWSWGTMPVGVINQTALTDDGSEYAETQCGAMETQLDFDFLPPYKSRQWREWWLPLRDIGGLTCASEYVGVKLGFTQTKEQEDFTVTLAVCPAMAFNHTKISISIPEQVIYENTIDLTPQKPWRDEFSVQASIIGDKPITLLILDAKGNHLIQYKNTRQTDQIEVEQPDEISIPETAQDFYILAQKHENFDNRAEAKDDYKRAIELDPTHPNANLNYAKMLLRSAQFDLADQYLACAQENGSDQAAYYRGVIALFEDRLNDAYQYFDSSIEQPTLAAASAIGLGKIAARKGEWQRAVELFLNAAQLNDDQTFTLTLEAVALRQVDQFNKAAYYLEKVLVADPLIHLANYEWIKVNSVQGSKLQTEFDRLLEDDHQYHIDLACNYLDLGLFGDAKNVLEKAWTKKQNVMIAYLLAFLNLKMEDQQKYSEWLTNASSVSLDFGFPSRLEEIIALKTIHENEGGDDRIKYLLGNFYYAHERFDEAISVWEEALQSLNNYDVILRNLGMAYWEQDEGYEKAIKYFEKALQINPENQDLYLHLDDLYAKLDFNNKQEDLLKKIDAIPDIREDVRKRKIKIMIDLGYFEQALEILTQENFMPLEMDQSFHDQYVKALMMRVEKNIAQDHINEAIEDYKLMLKYPENLGVGEPTKRTHAQIYYLLGCAYEKVGNHKEAIDTWYKCASEHHHSDSELFKYIQMALDKINRYSELGIVKEN